MQATMMDSLNADSRLTIVIAGDGRNGEPADFNQ